MRRRAILLVLGLLVVLMSTACLAIGPQEVQTVLPDDQNKMAKAVSSYTESYKVPPQWAVGVVFQTYWTPSRGINSDPYNKVRIRVYVPNGIITIIPCSAYQEEVMARTYGPGDIIAFHIPTNNPVGAQKQDELMLCNQDVILLEENGLSQVALP